MVDWLGYTWEMEPFFLVWDWLGGLIMGKADKHKAKTQVSPSKAPNSSHDSKQGI